MGRLAKVGRARRPACERIVIVFSISVRFFNNLTLTTDTGTECLSVEEGEDEVNQGAILSPVPNSSGARGFLFLGE